MISLTMDKKKGKKKTSVNENNVALRFRDNAALKKNLNR